MMIGGGLVENWNGTQRQIAQYIYSHAPAYGVDPKLAPGVASYEGLYDSKNGSLYFSGDNGHSFGPFQLNTAGGLGSVFQSQYGPLSTSNGRQHVDFSLAHMAKSTGDWNAIGNRPGAGKNNFNTGPITADGARVAQTLELTPSGDASGGGLNDFYGVPQTQDQTLIDLQADYPGDPSLGGLYPSSNTWADTVSDVSQDYPTSAWLAFEHWRRWAPRTTKFDRAQRWASRCGSWRIAFKYFGQHCGHGAGRWRGIGCNRTARLRWRTWRHGQRHAIRDWQF